MLQVEPRKLVLQEFNGLRPVDQSWVRRQRQSVVKAANDVQPECVECADPHRRRRERIARGNPLAQFIGRLVGEGEYQDRGGIDAVRKQPFDATNKRPRLARTRPCLQLKRQATMCCRLSLRGVWGERSCHGAGAYGVRLLGRWQ